MNVQGGGFERFSAVLVKDSMSGCFNRAGSSERAGQASENEREGFTLPNRMNNLG